MNNPEVILRTLDRHLSEPARLILYGRAALALGFDDTPPHFGSTKDVDAILPEVEMSAIEEAVGTRMEDFNRLALFRPAIEDLMLTKMMRIDPQDREDLLFLMSRADLKPADIQHLSSQARVPEIQEIRDAFEANLAWL